MGEEIDWLSVSRFAFIGTLAFGSRKPTSFQQSNKVVAGTISLDQVDLLDLLILPLKIISLEYSISCSTLTQRSVCRIYLYGVESKILSRVYDIAMFFVLLERYRYL